MVVTSAREYRELGSPVRFRRKRVPPAEPRSGS
jgi:hypothetical protein